MKKLLMFMIGGLLLVSCGQGNAKDKSIADTSDSDAVEQKIDTDTVLGKTEKELASSRMIAVEEGENAKAVVKDGVVKTLPKNGKSTLLDFTATWCGPCRKMKPVFEELEDTYDDRMNFVTIDIDLNPELASHYGVRAVPTFIFLDKDGKTVKVVEGAVPQATLENQIARMISE